MRSTARKLNKYSKLELKECSEFIECIYTNNDECFVRVLSKQKGINKVYPVNALKETNKLRQILNKLGREDIFLSLNPFRTMEKATRNNLFCINTIAVDVDYKKIKEFKDLDPMQVIKLLELDFFDARIPTPNYIEYGNQLRLLYSIETCYIPKYRDNVIRLAKRVSEVFAKELKEYGAEKQNIESYMRVPRSINSKTGAEIKIFAYENAIRYTLGEIQELWLEELPKWYKRKKGRVQANKKVLKLHNVYSLNSNRLIDFELIQSHLNSMGVTELRARLCFLYRNYILIRNKYQNGVLTEEDYSEARDKMLKFNNNFNKPLRENVIESATRVVNNRQYLYKNDSLSDFLELTYEECELIGLQSIYKPKTQAEWNKDYHKKNSNRLKEKYKKELKDKGKLTKKEEIDQRRVKIKDLVQKGLKQKDIYTHLNISKRTCINDIKYLKEQGLI